MTAADNTADDSTFVIIIDNCEGNLVGKSLFSCYAKC